MFQELAFQIAKKAHSKQVDKAGKDYILHPMKVASYMDTDTEKAVAYLHDVLEDTNVTEDELRIKIIKLLGKDADEILELMISQELIEKCG